MKHIIALLIFISPLTSAQESVEQKSPPTNQKEKPKKLTDDESTNELLDHSDIDKITKDDIPEEWKTTLEIQESKKDTHSKIYTRGKNTSLKIEWSDKNITPNIKNYAIIKFIHKEIEIVVIYYYNNNLIITPNDKNPGYKVNTIFEEGEHTVQILGPDDYYEIINLNGRDSTLMDDLKYTKQAAINGKLKKHAEGLFPKKEKK